MEHVHQRLAIVGRNVVVMLCWHACLDTHDALLSRVVTARLESVGTLTGLAAFAFEHLASVRSLNLFGLNIRLKLHEVEQKLKAFGSSTNNTEA